MSILSHFEPPMDIEEKDYTFLKLDRSPSHLVDCSQSKKFPFTNIYSVSVKESHANLIRIWIEHKI